MTDAWSVHSLDAVWSTNCCTGTEAPRSSTATPAGWHRFLASNTKLYGGKMSATWSFDVSRTSWYETRVMLVLKSNTRASSADSFFGSEGGGPRYDAYATVGFGPSAAITFLMMSASVFLPSFLSHLSRVHQLLAGESLVEELGHVAAPGGGGDEGEGSRHLRQSSAAIHRVVLLGSWRCQDRHWNRFEKPDCMFVEHLREDPSNSWSISASMHPLSVIKNDVPDDRSVRHTSRRNRETQELDTSLQCLVRHQGTGSQHRLQKLPTGGGRHLMECIQTGKSNLLLK